MRFEFLRIVLFPIFSIQNQSKAEFAVFRNFSLGSTFELFGWQLLILEMIHSRVQHASLESVFLMWVPLGWWVSLVREAHDLFARFPGRKRQLAEKQSRTETNPTEVGNNLSGATVK